MEHKNQSASATVSSVSTSLGSWPEKESSPKARRAGIRQKMMQHPLLNLMLLTATLATTTWAGAAYQGISLWRDPGSWTAGLPYALAVLIILGVHEMGHYFAARYHRLRVSLPYFIPMPFAIGTLGAFVRLEDEPKERRKMFDVAVAGPLAGLVAALGVLAVGLLGNSASTAPPVDPSSSVLLGLLANAVGQDAAVAANNPLVFAGWLGLMLTAFNLLPVGQLDGGHMARALFGERAAVWISRVTLGAMLLLGLFVWHGFLLWTLVAFLFSGRSGRKPSDGASVAQRGLLFDVRRHALGTAAFALIALILVPMPGFTSTLVASGCPWL